MMIFRRWVAATAAGVMVLYAASAAAIGETRINSVGYDVQSGTITIDGERFADKNPLQGGIKPYVEFGGTAVAVSSWTKDEITIVVPGLSVGEYQIYVERKLKPDQVPHQSSATDIRTSYSLTVEDPAGGGTGVPGPAGPVGPAGPAGPAGPVGPVGPVGATGPTGPMGPVGAIGPAGPAGTVGATGPAGPAGTVGATGPAGPAGSQGPAGPQGTTGPAGPMGPLGPTGPQGPQGVAGPAGPAGATGATGPMGSPGSDGETGPAGPGQWKYVVKYDRAFTGIPAGASRKSFRLAIEGSPPGGVTFPLDQYPNGVLQTSSIWVYAPDAGVGPWTITCHVATNLSSFGLPVVGGNSGFVARGTSNVIDAGPTARDLVCHIDFANYVSGFVGIHGEILMGPMPPAAPSPAGGYPVFDL